MRSDAIFNDRGYEVGWAWIPPEMLCMTKKREKTGDIDPERNLRVPVERIRGMTIPNKNPIDLEENEKDDGIKFIIGKKRFEIIVKTERILKGDIILEINKENRIEIYESGRLFEVTEELPQNVNFGSMTSRYNVETRILSITGTMHDRVIRVERS